MARGLTAQRERRLAYLRSKQKGVVFSAKQAKKLKQMANAEEVKYFDTSLGALTSAILPTGVVINNSLVLMQEGDGESSRDGSKVGVNALYINGTLELPSSSNLSVGTIINNASVRIVVVQDRAQASGSTVSWTDVFQDADYDSFRNLDNSGRFKILSDKRYDMYSQMGTSQTANQFSSGEARRSFNYKFPKLNLPIEYDASSGALTDLTKNNIFVLGICEGPTNLQININGTARIRYIG